ncbi:MAG: hypothetical protein M3Z25_14565 [Actinomycetota bacterium]|nr:hypothetical protein [Actinomycetota bacterium]
MTATVDTDESIPLVSAPLVAALESAWVDIWTRHPEIPAVVVILGAGSGGGAGLTLGHFATLGWHHGEASDTARLPVVFIGGEGLARGPVIGPADD